MPAGLRFRHDKHGNLRAKWSGADAAGQLLARFFEADLGADSAYCDRLRDEAQKHIDGRSPPWRTSGNGFAVAIKAARVTLRPLFGADEGQTCSLTAAEFVRLLRRWRKLID